MKIHRRTLLGAAAALATPAFVHAQTLEKPKLTIAVGGKPHDGPGGGHYVQPTLVTNATFVLGQRDHHGISFRGMG